MATSQYVGARYVPLFAEPAQWDKTKQYEPLTIVLDHGNSYTSRQFVPTGIELTNEAFWALTGNYNAQVEQYRQEVTSYDERIKTAQTTADGATTKANEADTKANNANAAIEAEVTRATAKESEIQSLAETNETDIAHLDAQMAATTGSELLNKIAKETSDRTEAINTEKTERTAADEALSTRIDTEKSERESAITNLDTELKAAIADKFPIGTDSILDGAITSTKLAQSAINAILNGATIRCFDSANSKADNTGMVCPSGFKLSGCYIEPLKLLIINTAASTNVKWSSFLDTSNLNGITLPSYVPRVKANTVLSSAGVIVSTASDDFIRWSGLGLTPTGFIGPSTEVGTSGTANGNTLATIVVCLAPYIAGTQVTNAQYADYANQNAVI